MHPPPHAVTTGVSRLDPGSAYYRQVVGAACLIILIVTLQLVSLIAPRKHRKLNEHTKAAALAHLALAVCSCVVALVAAGLNQLGRQWTYAVLSTFLSGTQMVDGIYTWERYAAPVEFGPPVVAQSVIKGSTQQTQTGIG